MQKFDAIRPFYDSEINEAFNSIIHHPMMKALMNFTFPEMEDEEWKEKFKSTSSIREFQQDIIYHSVQQVIQRSSEGVTTSGFEKLEKNTSYLFVSNHRDIILDTCLLNSSLLEHGLLMTGSAIGDNLVKKAFLFTLSKLNRNFLVRRGLTPREMLASSKLLAEYIRELLLVQNHSVWIAQREGRTKDGNDATNPGVLKMVGMAAGEDNLMDYFKKIKIVPISISYEYDPTDALKMPQLLAEADNKVYIKEKNEDFMTLLSGIIGQKKRIHIHVGTVLNERIDVIKNECDNPNKQTLALAQAIDASVLRHYKLWPTNFIAYDLLHKTDKYAKHYTDNEKSLFERRLELRIDCKNPIAVQSFLAMYSNPVVNKLKYTDVD